MFFSLKMDDYECYYSYYYECYCFLKKDAVCNIRIAVFGKGVKKIRCSDKARCKLVAVCLYHLCQALCGFLHILCKLEVKGDGVFRMCLIIIVPYFSELLYYIFIKLSIIQLLQQKRGYQTGWQPLSGQGRGIEPLRQL